MLTVETDGADLEGLEPLEEGVMSSPYDIGNEATITFHFSTDKPLPPVDAPVSHYEVPKLLKDYGADYVAIELRPPSSSDSDWPGELRDGLTVALTMSSSTHKVMSGFIKSYL